MFTVPSAVANFLKVCTFTLQDKAFFNGAIYFSSLVLTPCQPSSTIFNLYYVENRLY